MHSAGDLVICLGDCNGHVGRHSDGLDEGNEWRRSQEFRRKNVIRVLSGEGIVCVKYMV